MKEQKIFIYLMSHAQYSQKSQFQLLTSSIPENYAT